MSTYTENDDAFSDHMKWTSIFAAGQSVGIGVCPACLQAAHFNLTEKFLRYRFGLIKQSEFSEVDLWVLGYRAWEEAVAPWLPHLSAFLAGGVSERAGADFGVGADSDGGAGSVIHLAADGGSRAGDVSKVAGGGLLINEGDMLFANCSFIANKNMNMQDPTADEQDVCAFGAATQAIFDKYSAAICTACGGHGTCI
jgi:hypothetical protein